MESDIERWRKLGHDTDATMALAGASLEPRRSRRPKPIHHQHNHHLNPSGDPARTGKSKEGGLFVYELLDKLSKGQKKDVHNIWSGHLNHDNLNRRMAKLAIKHPHHPENKLGSSSKTLEDAATRKQEETARRHHLEKDANLAHVDVPDNFEKILEQYDMVCGLGRGHMDIGALPGESGSSNAENAAARVSEASHKSMHADGKQEDAGTARISEVSSGSKHINEENHSVKGSETTPHASGGDIVLKAKDASRLHFLPSSSLHTTKAEKYMVVKNVDSNFVDSRWNYKKSRHSEAEKASELTDFLRKELHALNCPAKGPDIRRLQVYSACFDRVISEFKSYSSVLAEIKSEYDLVISSFDFDQTELEFLRSKVRKLIAQNQNRLLLRYERRKSNELEKKLEDLKDENENLKSELRRKLALYAGYLPPSILHEKRKHDPLLLELEPQAYLENEDPISQYERLIHQLSEETRYKTSEIDRLTKAQRDDFVPKPVSDHLAESLKETETNYEKLKVRSMELESELSEKQSLVTKLENSLREKEEQYHFLISEYTGLSESIKKNATPA